MSASNGNNKNSSNNHSNNPRKILVVDDDPDLTSLFEMVLEMSGFEVDAYNARRRNKYCLSAPKAVFSVGLFYNWYRFFI
jgi:response regulator RpfG family c-di-GMP phosphodiesterase